MYITRSSSIKHQQRPILTTGSWPQAAIRRTVSLCAFKYLAASKILNVREREGLL